MQGAAVNIPRHPELAFRQKRSEGPSRQGANGCVSTFQLLPPEHRSFDRCFATRLRMTYLFIAFSLTLLQPSLFSCVSPAFPFFCHPERSAFEFTRKSTYSKDLLKVPTFVRAASINGMPVDEFGQICPWASPGDSSTPFVIACAQTHFAQNDILDVSPAWTMAAMIHDKTTKVEEA